MYYKRIAYYQVDENKYVTYLFPAWGRHLRYKILNQQELEDALTKCKLAGWKVSNITNLANKMLERKPKYPTR